MSAAPESTPAASLNCSGLGVTVAGRELVRELELQVAPGQFIAMLGPNGVGKTLSFMTLAGLRPAATGAVRLGDTELGQLSRSEVARQLGLMLQHQADPFPTTVLETALLGRHAQTGIWHWQSPADVEQAREALQMVDLAGLEHRAAGTLSGGERRRLALATLLTQNPQLFLLDEPVNHLDPQHRFMVLDCLSALCAAGKSVIASLHDPMLAARHASHVLLLYGDGRWELGTADDLLTANRMEALYQTPFASMNYDGGKVLFPVAPQA
jgi:iron complex transport system ATP-binding protein